MIWPARVCSTFLLAALAVSGCSGELVGGGSSRRPDQGGSGGAEPGPAGTGSGSTGSTTGSGPTGSAGPDAPGPAPLRRLTVREYNNTVRDLLGSAAVQSLGTDQDAGGFRIGGPITTSTDATKLLEAAERLADAAAIDALLPCRPVPVEAAAQQTCARDFISAFGARAFRRPLGDAEIEDLLAVYTGHRGAEIGYDFEGSIRAVLAAMLTSPFFLYHAERGDGPPVREGALVRLSGYELASRLSYGLWASMPDEALFTAAREGALGTADEVAAHTRRMLKDPRAAAGIADFHAQWLEIAALPSQPAKDSFEAFSPTLVDAMLAETAAFTTRLFSADDEARLETLLTSNETTIDGALARLYGVSGLADGEARTVALDARQRAGVFTQAAFLTMHADAAESHPVRRGAAILRRLLCTEIHPPEDMDTGQPEAPKEGLTTRERFAAHAENQCATCHRLTDPLGFAFESYDALGAYRTTERGKPVDASGVLQLASGDIAFDGAVDLMKALATTPEVRMCLTTQWFRYLQRRAETKGDQASLDAAAAAFARSSYDLRELLVALTTSRAFTLRSLSPGEVLP